MQIKSINVGEGQQCRVSTHRICEVAVDMNFSPNSLGWSTLTVLCLQEMMNGMQEWNAEWNSGKDEWNAGNGEWNAGNDDWNAGNDE
jgi:hypothetical protein